MIYYFYSQIESFLKINGIYEGIINKNISFKETDNQSLFEIIPISSEYIPTIFNFEYNKNIKKISFLDGVLIIPYFKKSRNLKYNILFQKIIDTDLGELLLSVLSDGSVKFYLQGAFTISEELPFIPVNCNYEYKNGFLILIFSNNLHAIYAYNLHQGGILCFKNLVNAFSFNNSFEISLNHQNITKITETITWKIENNFSLENIFFQRKNNIFELNNFLFVNAFFEEILLNANYEDYLSPELKTNKEEIKNYLGEFKDVFCVVYKNQLKTCLVYDEKIKFASVDMHNFNINNIYLLENNE